MVMRRLALYFGCAVICLMLSCLLAGILTVLVATGGG